MSIVITDLVDCEQTYSPGKVSGNDCVLKNLTGCTIKILDWVNAAVIEGCKDCTIKIGPISETCIITDCGYCTLSISCSGVLIVSSVYLDLFLFTETDPKIKNSNNLKFAPYNTSYSGQEHCFSLSGLNPYKDKWSEVYDFNRNDFEAHYELLSPKSFKEDFEEFSGLGLPTNPVPRHLHYGGSLKYEIIPYSKLHKVLFERRDLPPSNKIIHNENDTRKSIPFTFPIRKQDILTSPDGLSGRNCSNLRLKCEYIFKKTFKMPDNCSNLNAYKLDTVLKTFKKTLDKFNKEKEELLLGWLISIISCFLIFIQLQIFEIISTWFITAWGLVAGVVILSEIFLSSFLCIKAIKIQKKCLKTLTKLTEKTVQSLKPLNVQIKWSFDYIEIYINNT